MKSNDLFNNNIHTSYLFIYIILFIYLVCIVGFK